MPKLNCEAPRPQGGAYGALAGQMNDKDTNSKIFNFAI
jgi:hypothetical protein